MNTNLRAVLFGAAVAAVLTVTLDTVTAAEPAAIRLDAVEVTANRSNFDTDGNLNVVRLDPVVVTAHRDAI